jgi:UDP-3-O-[3-hydroxymyristoyl] glucosamine N-acyltransferase
MRIVQMITVGVAGLALSTEALAACQPGFTATGTAPTSYCKADAFAGTPTIGPRVNLGVDAGNLPSVHISGPTTIGADSAIGDYTRLGSPSGLVTIAPKTTIGNSGSYGVGTTIVDGVIGRRDQIGDQVTADEDLSVAADVIIGRNVQMGARVTIGFGAVINDNATLGDDITLGNLSSVGFGASIGDDTDVGRGTIIGNYAEVANVELGPDITIGTGAIVGDPNGTKARIRSGAELGKYSSVEGGTRVGRDATVGDYATVEQGATMRTGAQVEAGGTVEAGLFIPRCATNPPADTDRFLVAGTSCPSTYGATALTSSSAVTGGMSCLYTGAAGTQNECLVPGNPASIPTEPSGTFFSAAGGKVCVEAPGHVDSTCHFLGMEDDLLVTTQTAAGMGFARNLGPVACTATNKAHYNGSGVIDGAGSSAASPANNSVCTDNNPSTGCCAQPDRYCLDDDQDNACDTHVSAGQPAQAILITAPDTIGVSPYSYNNGSTSCPVGQTETGSAPNITCTVTVSGGGYTLQAGPIYVLSPPSPN